MARIFNTNDHAVPVKIGGTKVSLGAREGWEGALSSSDATEARKVAGIEVTGEPFTPPSLSHKTKAQLLDIAETEHVEVADDATNAEIVRAVKADRKK